MGGILYDRGATHAFSDRGVWVSFFFFFIYDVSSAFAFTFLNTTGGEVWYQYSKYRRTNDRFVAETPQYSY
ncbi:hypothetical protein HOY80DRAFT_711841 [Tuber brumale]|nr:hypothetical protein HOY80DRAFT_711841 [Tuber brumale]